MAKRISLHEFQAGLARRLAEAATPAPRRCSPVQAGQRNWLVDLTEAGEILAVPPLAPGAPHPPWFRGLASVRGNLFGVVDFAAFHGEPPSPPWARPACCWSASAMELNCAILARPRPSACAASTISRSPQPDPTDPLDRRRAATPSAPWTRLKVAELLNRPRFLDAAQS